MNLEDVSAVLITTRDEYPAEILESLPAFGEVIIARPDSIHGRYAAINSARADVVYVQDDDVVVDPAPLWQRFDGRVTNYLTSHHHRFYQELCDGRITLIGFGAFLPKRFAESLDVYEARWGRDYLYYREADRIVTWLNAPHNTFITDAIRHMPFAEDDSRLSSDAKHYDHLKEVVARLRLLTDR